MGKRRRPRPWPPARWQEHGRRRGLSHGDSSPGILRRVTSSPDRRWESATEWPLTISAVAFLAAYAWPILDSGLASPWSTLCLVVTWGTWALFALDYLVRLALAEDRAHFLRRNLVDLTVIVLPLVRPLRLLRLLTALNAPNRRAGGSLRGRVAVYVVGSTILVLFVAALAVLDAERDKPGANIVNFPDALWWSITTVSTVGYGDRFPVSGAGRLIAAGLMVAGIALLGVVTASLASWLISKVREVQEDSQAATRRDVTALTAEVAPLRRDLSTLHRT